jgi:Tol biopolymer transport system component
VITVLLSTTETGFPIHGDSVTPSLDSDGNVLAYASTATDLDPGDANGAQDVFWLDRTGPTVENASRDSTNPSGDVQLGSDSAKPAISGDGRFVAFESRAPLFVGASCSAPCVRNVYRRERVVSPSGVVSHITLHAINQSILPNADCTDVSISADGRYVAFRSAATNLLAAPYPNPIVTTRIQIYVSDMSTSPPTLTLVSRAQASPLTPADGNCGPPRISANGNVVVFASTATNLENPASDGASHVFLGTPAGSTIEFVSLSNSGAREASPNVSLSPAVSADGRYVAFTTTAALAPGMAGGNQEIVRRDRVAPGTALVTSNDAGAEADSTCGFAAISDDGQRVAFLSVATNLTPEGGNTLSQIYLRDMGSGVHLVSTALSGGLADIGATGAPAISGNGVYVAWSSRADNLFPNDTNGFTDVFIRGPFPR